MNAQWPSTCCLIGSTLNGIILTEADEAIRQAFFLRTTQKEEYGRRPSGATNSKANLSNGLPLASVKRHARFLIPKDN